ncbi:hypothetical protein DCAR_0521932 [Daucus carota subsp. sativus]|uniref:Protein-tyrosine-phosphatase n=1 Tax=Daucus carota subsp. sativus TaxID=79200 RepID=A0AAF1B2U4_DAUCS|nr:PREDICTED: protein-tyrosine-phosphatase MKP1-like [Daucus carota subsp. sativus]WOH02543.1 hypothetical protein DCAR_0521932 [Daucus carota subsp. sativus]
MLEKDDPATDDGAGGAGDSGASFSETFLAQAPQKTFSRSDSRTMVPSHDLDGGNESLDQNDDKGGDGRLNVHSNLRTRGRIRSKSHLPPLQPLTISQGQSNVWPGPGADDVRKLLPCTPGGRYTSDGGERSKLDLSSGTGNLDKNSGLSKKDNIAMFDKECSRVAEHIYLGGNAVARDREMLLKHGITYILNCVGFVCPEYFKTDFVYYTLWLHDSPSEDITSILYDVFDYFEYAREQQGRVFVHCCQGISRSPSLVIAYRMWREGQSFDEAFQNVKAARKVADPNMGFACQLLQCQKRVHAFPLSPNSLLRMYRVASHSSYDPLHLVPKMLNSPTPAALDSRGAFIIHIPSTIYIWIGLKCNTIMERDARAAVCQMVRYEKLKKSVVDIKEGLEPSHFWDAFSTLLPLMEKSCDGVDVTESSKNIIPGERQVSSYTVEFEVFQKAVVGGFVPPSGASETDNETHLPVRESCWSTLRLKHICGSMEEFASASKPSLSGFYPDSGSELRAENCPNQNQLVVYRWPGLEKMVTFSSADLDSKDIFILVSASGLRTSMEHRVLYFWVGKSFSNDNGKRLLKADHDIGVLEEINWNEVCVDVISKMGLPNDTEFKIVKQDEEPEEFLALLDSL